MPPRSEEPAGGSIHRTGNVPSGIQSSSARPGSAGSTASQSGLSMAVPGPPAWWLGSGRESPATGIAGREAKHTNMYRQFTQRAEMLLATIDASVLNSTVATHIQGRTQMIDVATFWDAWEGEIPPEGAMPEWRPYSGPFFNVGRVHPDSLPLTFRLVVRNRTQRTLLVEASTADFPIGMASIVYNDTPMAPGISQDMILTIDPTKGEGEMLADVVITCDGTTTLQESQAGGAEILLEGDEMLDTVRSRSSMGEDSGSGVWGGNMSMSARSGKTTKSGAGNLTGTRMVEYTTEVRIPLYVWMDPYCEFQ